MRKRFRNDSLITFNDISLAMELGFLIYSIKNKLYGSVIFHLVKVFFLKIFKQTILSTQIGWGSELSLTIG